MLPWQFPKMYANIEKTIHQMFFKTSKSNMNPVQILERKLWCYGLPHLPLYMYVIFYLNKFTETQTTSADISNYSICPVMIFMA